MVENALKPVLWVGSSKADLKKFPAAVQDQVGFALYQAQVGLKPRDAKQLKGQGSNVLEVVSRHEWDAYRTVVHGPVQGGSLCPACLPEEVQTGHRDTEAGA